MMPVFVVIVIIFHFQWHSPPRAWIWRVYRCRHIQFIEMDSIRFNAICCDTKCVAHVTALPQRFSLFSAWSTSVNFRDGLPIWGTNSKYAFPLQSHSISWDPSRMTHLQPYIHVGPMQAYELVCVCVQISVCGLNFNLIWPNTKWPAIKWSNVTRRYFTQCVRFKSHKWSSLCF